MSKVEQNTHSALVDRPLASPFAYVGLANGTLRTICASEFLSHVMYLAERLPDAPVAINICQDRYRFAVAFCAVIVRGQANALAPSHHLDVQQRTANSVGDCYVLHDGAHVCPQLADFELSDAIISNTEAASHHAVETVAEVAQIPLAQIAAICFTSGSTGEPTATRKSWQTLLHSSRINDRHYLRNVATPLAVLATVPPQHMYGLETSILLPLVADVAVHHGKPLFPADIANCLAQLPAPRSLVSTPIHLKALHGSGVALSETALCLSATAPLDNELAANVAAATGAVMREIYGCSEAGSLATRDLLVEDLWQPFDGLNFSQAQESTYIDADHLLSRVELQDILAFESSGGFRLLGRQSDMVNIAGKRGSLQALTSLIVDNPNVDDAIVFVPETSPGDAVHRLAALVVSQQRDGRRLQAWIRERVDNAFVPRPIVFVDSLPRSSTGKLPRQALLKIFAQARK